MSDTNEMYTVGFNGTTWAEKGLTREAAIALVRSYDLNQHTDRPVAIRRGDQLVANVGNAGIKWIPQQTADDRLCKDCGKSCKRVPKDGRCKRCTKAHAYYVDYPINNK